MTLHQPGPSEPTKRVRVAPSTAPPAEPGVADASQVAPPPAAPEAPAEETLAATPPPAPAAEEAPPSDPPPTPPAERAPQVGEQQGAGGLLERLKRRFKG